MTYYHISQNSKNNFAIKIIIIKKPLDQDDLGVNLLLNPKYNKEITL